MICVVCNRLQFTVSASEEEVENVPMKRKKEKYWQLDKLTDGRTDEGSGQVIRN